MIPLWQEKQQNSLTTKIETEIIPIYPNFFNNFIEELSEFVINAESLLEYPQEDKRKFINWLINARRIPIVLEGKYVMLNLQKLLYGYIDYNLEITILLQKIGLYMPGLCIKTGKFASNVLNINNIEEYTDNYITVKFPEYDLITKYRYTNLSFIRDYMFNGVSFESGVLIDLSTSSNRQFLFVKDGR